MKESSYKTYDELPLFLNAGNRISRHCASAAAS